MNESLPKASLPKASLDQVSLFRGLTFQQIKSIKNSIKERSFRKGDVLFFDGKPCDQIIIIRSGRVKVFRTSATGREQILEILGPGDTCACNPGASAWCCSSSSQALTDLALWILPRDRYIRMVRSNSNLARTLNELFARRLQKFSSLIEEVSLDDPRRRLVKFLLDLSAPGEKFIAGRGLPELPFTHEEIAQRLGLARETVTRQLQQLKKSGWIDLKQRRVIVLERSGLKELLRA